METAGEIWLAAVTADVSRWFDYAADAALGVAPGSGKETSSGVGSLFFPLGWTLASMHDDVQRFARRQ